MYAINPTNRKVLWIFETGSREDGILGGEIMAAPSISVDGKVGPGIALSQIGLDVAFV